jgi:hypothetical protein
MIEAFPKLYQWMIEAFPNNTKHVKQKLEADLGDAIDEDEGVQNMFERPVMFI